MENQIVLSMGSVISVIVALIGSFAWFYKLIIKKLENIDSKFEKKFDKLDNDVKEVKERIIVLEVEAKNTNQRLSNIEGHLLPTRKVYEFKESKHEEESKEN